MSVESTARLHVDDDRPAGSMSERTTRVATLAKITPCLWFDTEGEAAAAFYTGTFEYSRILQVSHYGSAGPRPEGTVMMVSFELEDRSSSP